MGSRSSLLAVRARKRRVPAPISAVTSGLATRLWYQSGWVSAPALDAKTATASPRSWYIIGFTRSWPERAPVVWSRSIGAPSNWPPTAPSLARNSSITLAFQSAISLISVLSWSAAHPPGQSAARRWPRPAVAALRAARPGTRAPGGRAPAARVGVEWLSTVVPERPCSAHAPHPSPSPSPGRCRGRRPAGRVRLLLGRLGQLGLQRSRRSGGHRGPDLRGHRADRGHRPPAEQRGHPGAPRGRAHRGDHRCGRRHRLPRAGAGGRLRSDLHRRR